MFNHVSVGTRDLERASRFYDAALGALGYRRTMSEDFGNAWGLEWPEFWVAPPLDGEANAGNGVHVAFIAPSREAVDAFHAAALAEGGSDAGAPGERDYTPTTTPPSCATRTATSSRPCTCPKCPFPTQLGSDRAPACPARPVCDRLRAGPEGLTTGGLGMTTESGNGGVLRRTKGRGMLYESIIDTVGDTPCVRINRLAPANVELYVKCEFFNPAPR